MTCPPIPEEAVERATGKETLQPPQKPFAAQCACCGEYLRKRDPDPWEGRLGAYCEDCAEARCDAYPGDCGKERLVRRSCALFLSQEEKRALICGTTARSTDAEVQAYWSARQKLEDSLGGR